jgi:hypothetical protein
MHSVTMPRQHGASRADRVTMSNSPAFDIDEILGKPKLARDRGNGGKGFIDLDTLDRANVQPARCNACLTAGTGPRPNMPGSTAAIP